MSINTTLAGLSQNQALNGPDGTVDLPSTMDDAQRYALSFIAMLRDGAGFTAGAITTALGWTPPRQGGNSSGTTTNVVSIGWNASLGKIVAAIDTNQFANKWPIDTTGDAGSVNGVSGWTYTNSGANPVYLWCSDGSGAYQHLTQPGALSVNYANSANYATSAGSAPANGGTSSNSNAVNGQVFSYSNAGNSPTWLWGSDSSGTNYLANRGSISVNYANTAGSAPANGGTSSNSNGLGGIGPSGWVQNTGSVVSLFNGGYSSMNASIGGTTCFWGMSISDERLKEAIAPTKVDSLERIAAIDFVEYRFKRLTDKPRDAEGNETDAEPIQIDDGRLHPVGLLAQQAQTIAPEWIETVPGGIGGEHLQPNLYPMLMDAMHAVQQLRERVLALEGSK